MFLSVSSDVPVTVPEAEIFPDAVNEATETACPESFDTTSAAVYEEDERAPMSERT